MDLYTVRPGDSLRSIARRCGADTAQLLRDNQLNDPARLIANLSLLLPGTEQTSREELFCCALAGAAPAADVLRETLPCLSAVCLSCCHITAQGELAAVKSGAVEAVREQGTAPFLTVTNLGETGGFSSENAHALLSNPAAQDRLLTALLAELEKGNFTGADFHFQYIYPFDRDGYTRFLCRVAERLHGCGYYLFVNLAPKESEASDGLLCAAHDYAALGVLADRVVLLSCEWGYPHSAPQAISPIGRVRRVLDYARSVVPADKLLMGITAGGCRWKLPWRQGDSAVPIGSAEAVNLAVAVGAELKYDRSSEAPFFTYTDPAGERWVVWFEDPRSLRAKLLLAAEYGLGGICWRSIERLYRPALLLQQDCCSAVKLI